MHDSRPDIVAWPVPPPTTCLNAPTTASIKQQKQPTASNSAHSASSLTLTPTVCTASMIRSPFLSPQPSPVPRDNALREEDSAKLLSMLKAVASASNSGWALVWDALIGAFYCKADCQSHLFLCFSSILWKHKNNFPIGAILALCMFWQTVFPLIIKSKIVLKRYWKCVLF